MRSLWLRFPIALMSALVFLALEGRGLAQQTESSAKQVKARAAALLQGGKSQEAHELLKERLDENLDDPEYRFLIGMAALDSGDPDEAIDHFEAALAENPKLSRVRLDLARAYSLDGRPRAAKSEFQRVLDTNPPEQVRDNIQRYIAAIDHGKNWRVHVSGGYLYDDNVNAGPTTDTVAFFGVPFALSPDAKKCGDSGFVSRVSADHLLPFSDEIGLRTSLSFDSVTYFHLDDFNVEAIGGSTGPQLRTGRFLVSLPFAANYSRLGDEPYGVAYGIAPEVRYAVTKRLSFDVAWLAQRTDYWARPERDGDLWTATGSARYLFGEQSFVEVGYRHTREDTREDFLANDLDAVYLGCYAVLPLGIQVYVRPTMAWNEYDEAEAAFPAARDEKRFSLDVNLAREIGHSGVFLSVGYTFTRNDSNLPLFDFDRNQVTLQASIDF